jgi:phospholipase/carboxylesterase
VAGRPRKGTNRWFRRFDATTFDQHDVRSEAEALAAFVEGAVTGYGLDPDRLVFLGFSNGANMLAALIQLHPGIVRRAILLRGVQPLEHPPAVDLAGTSVLVLAGRDDALARQAPAVADTLSARGADVDRRQLAADHELAAADVTESTEWLRRQFTGADQTGFG